VLVSQPARIIKGLGVRLSDAINSFLLVYAALFPIVNPVGGAPIFLGITRKLSADDRAWLSARIALNGFILLLGSVFVGSYVLEFFGITLPIVRVAGGLVVATFAWKLLHSGDQADHPPSAESRPVSAADAFYPLTMPLTVGPGSIAVAITLGSQRPHASGIADLVLIGGAAILGLAAIAFTIYVCYRYAARITGFLGENGTNVLVRLSAFILLCIGIGIIWSGYSGLTAANG
jgi:multiple antibiotic resistance protein